MEGFANPVTFYVNIISINVLKLFPGCQSVVCIIFSRLNFDLRTKTCFYSGMDDYAKECLQLIHALYFISIAILFIALSQYSATYITKIDCTKSLTSACHTYFVSIYKNVCM